MRRAHLLPRKFGKKAANNVRPYGLTRRTLAHCRSQV
jgi:hypothetical protein